MELLCPDVHLLTACYCCRDQCMPPYRMCLVAHLACGPCAAYQPECACGLGFAPGPHDSYDLPMNDVEHRCKYRAAAGDADGCCPDRRHRFRELRHHYRGSCGRNTFACPVNGRGHVCRVDTAAEHYDSAHGPFDEGEQDDQRSDSVSVALP